MGNILEVIVGLISTVLSPVLKGLIKTALDAWETEAKKTATPVDDEIVKLLKAITGN
jgi:hypothetical protein